VTFSSPATPIFGPEIFFERPPTHAVKVIGLVCAKSRRAGQFSCFLTGITGGSLFCLERAALLPSVHRVKTAKATSGAVLVIEDEADVLDLVRYHLEKAGFRVIVAPDGAAGLTKARAEKPDAIVLDLMLPGICGEDVCRELKRTDDTASIPVIMLTAKAQPEERVAGLELGADDYVAKPFSPRELVLRVEGVLRRLRTPTHSEKLSLGPFELDRGTFEVRLEGEKLDLTAIEFKLIAALMDKRGAPISRTDLLRDVWGYRNPIDSRTVDTHMRRLRAKLGAYADCLQTLRGEGYCFNLGEAAG
jgi:two-component system phosphate regulon response regulator PhoB